MQYFIKRGEKVQGPFSREQLIKFAKAKKFKSSDLISNDELGPFEELEKIWDSISGKNETTQSQTQNTCSFCGASVFKNATSCSKCASPIGSDLEPLVPKIQELPVENAPLAELTPTVIPDSSACHNCGATVPANAQFCPQCASVVSQQHDPLLHYPIPQQTYVQQPYQQMANQPSSHAKPAKKKKKKRKNEESNFKYRLIGIAGGGVFLILIVVMVKFTFFSLEARADRAARQIITLEPLALAAEFSDSISLEDANAIEEKLALAHKKIKQVMDQMTPEQKAKWMVKWVGKLQKMGYR